MNMLHKSRASLALVLTLVFLLCGCGAAPAAVESTAAPAAVEAAPVSVKPVLSEDGAYHVSTVDEFLSAIAPDAVIFFEPGVYDLKSASDYGKPDTGSEYYSWQECYDGFELRISGVDDLTLRADDAEGVTIAAMPRYANVLLIEKCSGITISDLTLGHTEEPGSCAGGVLRLTSCDNTLIEDCRLYGCGILGVNAYRCETLHVIDSDIYDCSVGAGYLESCRDVLFDDCDVYNCDSYTGIFDFVSCDECAVINSDVHDNTGSLLSASYTRGLYLGALDVHGNTFASGVLSSSAYPVTVEGCATSDNTYTDWYGLSCYGNEPSVLCVAPDGTELTAEALAAMTLGDDVAWTAKEKEPAPVVAVPEVDKDGAIHVTTVDELLAAIAPDTMIYLEPGLYDLSTASDYGVTGGEYYSWVQDFDGPELMISGVKNLTITAESPKSVTIAAMPRYADVLNFTDCDTIALAGLTVGHTEEPGSCSGGVLYFDNTDNVSVVDCALYGCGIMGVYGYSCERMHITTTEIYDCSQGGVSFYDCSGVAMTGCDLHDNGGPDYGHNNCTDMTVDGKPMTGGSSY